MRQVVAHRQPGNDALREPRLRGGSLPHRQLRKPTCGGGSGGNGSRPVRDPLRLRNVPDRGAPGFRGHAAGQQAKGAAKGRALCCFPFAGKDYFTSKSEVLTTLPSSEISTLYLPDGQPSGLLIWKAVVPSPEKSSALLSSCTIWLLSTCDHFAVSVPGTFAA